MARRFAQFLLILALDGVGIAAAGAATLIQLEPAAPRWRAVDPVGAAPRSQLIPVESAAAGPASPPSTLIPAELAVLPQRALPREGELGLPADAQVAAASIRPDYLIRPSLSGGMPTGFVGRWGDYFLSGSAGTPGKLRGGVVDGSLNLGMALGDPERLLGAEFYWGIGSIKNLNDNGAFGATLGRLLVNQPGLQVSVAGGVIDAFSYGSEANPQPMNGYGAITAALPLQPNNPAFPRLVQFTLGGGGSSFAAIDTTYQLTESGFFAAVGVDVLPNLGVSMGVSSRSASVNLSWVPLRTLPIFVNLLAADVFDVTPWGTVGVLTVGWGDNLTSGFVTK